MINILFWIVVYGMFTGASPATGGISLGLWRYIKGARTWVGQFCCFIKRWSVRRCLNPFNEPTGTPIQQSHQQKLTISNLSYPALISCVCGSSGSRPWWSILWCILPDRKYWDMKWKGNTTSS